MTMKPVTGLILGDMLGISYIGMEGPVKAESLFEPYTCVDRNGDDLPEWSTTYCTEMSLDIVQSLMQEERIDPLEHLQRLQQKAATNFFPRSIPTLGEAHAGSIDDQLLLLRGAVYGLSSANITQVLQHTYSDVSELTGQWASHACATNAAMMTHVALKRVLTLGGGTMEGRKDMEREALHYAGWTPNAWPQRDSVPAMLHQLRKILVLNGTFPSAMRESIRLGGNTHLRCAILGLWYGIMAPHTLLYTLSSKMRGDLGERCAAMDTWVSEQMARGAS